MSPWEEQKDEWTRLPARVTDVGLFIGDSQVMQFWERPLMKQLAEIVTRDGGDILEIGFGLGLSASAVVANERVTSYTVIEAHPQVVAMARQWAERQSVPTRIIEGFWQDVLPSLPMYDGILFDTYPLARDEKGKNHFPFISMSRNHLAAGGILTYYSDETTSFRAEHMRLILEAFEGVELIKVTGLKPPPECDYWDADHMVVPLIRNGRANGGA